MSQDITVELQKREVVGKGLGKLRSDGIIPAVIHDHGSDSIHVMGNKIEFEKVYKAAGKHHAVQLKIDGKDRLAIIKDADFDPKKHQLRHIVFQAIKQNETIQTEVPVVMEGDVPAEISGLMVINYIDNVQIEALPKDLPDNLSVDASKLVEIGDKIHVSDIKAPEGVTIITELEQAIAGVEETKAQVSEEETIEGDGDESDAESEASSDGENQEDSAKTED